MEYFCGMKEICKIEDGGVEVRKCIAQFDIPLTNSPYATLKGRYIPYVLDHTIFYQEGNIIRRFMLKENALQLVSLNSQNIVLTGYLEESKEIIINWKIHTHVLENKSKVYFRSYNSLDKFTKFDKGEFLQFKNKNVISHLAFNDHYLAFVTKSYEYKEQLLSFFVLIKIIQTDNNETKLEEIFSRRLNGPFSNYEVNGLLFNVKSPKILLRMKKKVRESFDHIIVFHIDTLEFTPRYGKKFIYKILEECYSLYTDNNLFYTYHNILKEIVIVVNTDTRLVLVIAESPKIGLYIYKKVRLMGGSFGVNLCNNRNNEIILLLKTHIYTKIHTYLYKNVAKILLHDILNDKIYNNIYDINGKEVDSNCSRIFFNQSGEEIFIVDGSKLHVLVYKSQVATLKNLCQMIVLQQYSEVQLKRMNLPRNIFRK